MISWLHGLTLEKTWWFFLALNVFIVLGSAAGNAALRRLAKVRFTGREQPLSLGDLGLVAACILLNALVSVLGWWLWKTGLLQLRPSTLTGTCLSLAAFLVVMDFCMYWAHRMAHWPLFYRWFHHRHHQHHDTNPFSLFVLHPFEVIAFGGTLLGAVWLVQPTAEALGSYLFLNIIFGSLGHADADLFPARWRHSILWRGLGLGSFHSAHHQEEQCNFGFYSVLWDRLAGTRQRPSSSSPGFGEINLRK